MLWVKLNRNGNLREYFLDFSHEKLNGQLNISDYEVTFDFDLDFLVSAIGLSLIY